MCKATLMKNTKEVNKIMEDYRITDEEEDGLMSVHIWKKLS